jgi:uncharacterized phage protein (TIGR01671 family)
MGREIKFLLQDKLTKKWETLKNFQLDYDDFGHYYIYMDGGSEDSDLSTLRQFTGLHDCKGQEIYEGDILKFEKVVMISRKKGEIKETAIAIVEWAHQGFTLNCISECRLRTLNMAEGEIIGNIWDNPELLEGK